LTKKKRIHISVTSVHPSSFRANFIIASVIPGSGNGSSNSGKVNHNTRTDTSERRVNSYSYPAKVWLQFNS